MARNISFTIKYWKQNGPQDQGHFDTHEMKNIPDDTSFLEMLDILNEELIDAGEEPFVFDHDCREGICGMCSLYIMVHLMVRQSVVLQHVSSTCVVSTMVTLSPLSLGVLQVSLSSRTVWLTVQHSTRSSRQVVTPAFVQVRLRMLMLS